MKMYPMHYAILHSGILNTLGLTCAQILYTNNTYNFDPSILGWRNMKEIVEKKVVYQDKPASSNDIIIIVSHTLIHSLN